MNAKQAISAARRHLTDSILLLEHQRFDNAAYLSGYVVELCLKAVVLVGGMPAEKEIGHDLPLMAGNAMLLAYNLSPSRRRYGLRSTTDLDQLLHTWKPDSRYEPEGSVSFGDAESRRRAAEEAYQQIAVEMILDGQG